MGRPRERCRETSREKNFNEAPIIAKQIFLPLQMSVSLLPTQIPGMRGFGVGN